MENSNNLWNEIADWLSGFGLPYMSKMGIILLLLAALLILLFIFWLIFRKVRLWYWKTDLQVDTLKSIDNRLHNVEDKLSQSAAVFEKLEDKMPVQNETAPLLESAQETEVPDIAGLTIVGKSGRVYTEAELELQIRD